MNLYEILKNIFKKLSLKNKEEKKTTKRPLTDYEFNEIKANKLNKLNKILDKISKKGIRSLNKNEKDFLNKYNK